MALSCVAAIVALPLIGMSAVVPQATDEADIGATHLAEVVRSVNGDHALNLRPVEPDGTAVRRAGSGSPEDPAVCINCKHRRDQLGLYWHWTTGENNTPWAVVWNFGHGEHDWLLEFNCDFIHGICINIPPPDGGQALNARELIRAISEAVASQDVTALAAYAKSSSVSLFAERSAIQIRGCDGETIVGHAPVSPELLAATEVAAVQVDSEG